MAAGTSPARVYRFISIPSKQYTTKMPTCLDVIHELGYETKFTSDLQLELGNSELPFPGNYYDFSGQIHTDGARQYMFHKTEDLNNVDRKDDIEKSVEADQQLKSFVKEGRLYYAVFHTVHRDEDGYMEPQYVYAFALGVSPSTGNFFWCIFHGTIFGSYER